ncbi:ADAMTS-like protein 1 isoform X4 [Ischnura elegans]|uniref:ADAMTS-like protein 1 isoform X4 n=1 Tax=Ischnura elegans TaxID=197161 RepID=UPI001ED8A11C|nr:ADAMTS-like protein 1 isoform X4 [Ischnura elegans]
MARNTRILSLAIMAALFWTHLVSSSAVIPSAEEAGVEEEEDEDRSATAEVLPPSGASTNLEELKIELEEAAEEDNSRSGPSDKRSGNLGASAIVPAPGARPVLGWSPWSEWSTCSRSCDGGASFQLRRCNAPTGCRGGDGVRYKICNMQPCPESRDFREQQCEASNDTPRDGQYYKWLPHHDEQEPCALICRAEQRVVRRPSSPLPPDHTPRGPLANDDSEDSDDDEGEDDEDDEEDDSPSAAMADEPSRVSPATPSAKGDDEEEELEPVDPPLIVRIASKVLDGTRCRPGSLDMCISGQCQRVGCDLRIGSTRRVDECGVCGGDGSSCARPLYHWEETPMSLCSVTCGGGYKMSRPVCRNRVSGKESDEQLCNAAQRPAPKIVECNTQRCPAKWSVDDWGPCSVSCGGGSRFRQIHCAEEGNGTRVNVPEHLCQGHKPRFQEPCNFQDCPRWYAGDWTGCSVSCGEGLQTRGVLCKDARGQQSNLCEDSAKPVATQSCRTGIPCPTHRHRYGFGSLNVARPEHYEWLSEREAVFTGHDEENEGEGPYYPGPVDLSSLPLVQQPYGSPHSQPPPQPPAVAERLVGEQVVPSESTFIAEQWGPCSVTCGEGTRKREVLCKIFLEFSRTIAVLPDQQCQGPKPAESERCILPACPILSLSSFIAEQWGPCSVTCGEGTRKREVLCKIFLELSRTIAVLPDQQCQGPKPAESERCILPACPIPSLSRIDNSRDVYGKTYADNVAPGGTIQGNAPVIKVATGGRGGQETYSWREQGFTHCSASCLGGVQDSIINCVRDYDQKVVSPYLCSLGTRPEGITRTCNDHPCPPRWNYSDFQQCSKSCGLGIQTRDVNCIHEVTRGGGNTVVVPNSMCPQPPPPDRQYCNVLDCPVRWHLTEWTKCSKSCGVGYKTRKAECKQVMAQSHVVIRPDNMCTSGKPPEKKPCNTKPCQEMERPHIAVTNQTYVQQSPKKKVTLKIGGSAIVFWGTQIKIKCPVKRFNRTKILWAKDHKFLNSSKKYRISKKGALRIQDVVYRDSGVYTCVAGRSSADLSLSVKPSPGHFPTSEEIERNADRMIPQQTNTVERISYATIDDSNGESYARAHGAEMLRPGDASNGNRQQHYPMQPAAPKSINTLEDHSHELRAGEATPVPLMNKAGNEQKNRGKSSSGSRPATMKPSLLDGEQGNLVPSPFSPTIGASPVTLAPPRLSFDGTVGDLNSNPTTSSGSSRPMPHLQRLLANLQNFWPLQAFGNSRGHRMVASAQEDGPAAMDQDGYDAHESTHDDASPIVVLGKGSSENLKFDWMITGWSQCSEKCGGTGFQMRAAHCMVRLHNTTQSVDGNLCEDAGLSTPTTIQKCGMEECPRWRTDHWTSCEESRCFTWNTAMQRREVTCQLPNGSSVDAHLCSERNKPPQRQECYNEKCKGTWKVGEWSECAAPCETQGIKYRILQCVWFGTKKPAGNACRDQPRPSVMKVCKGRPCAQRECKDHSKYCQNVKTMNLCRVYRYQYQCCHSCRSKG